MPAAMLRAAVHPARAPEVRSPEAVASFMRQHVESLLAEVQAARQSLDSLAAKFAERIDTRDRMLREVWRLQDEIKAARAAGADGEDGDMAALETARADLAELLAMLRENDAILYEIQDQHAVIKDGLDGLMPLLAAAEDDLSAIGQAGSLAPFSDLGDEVSA